MAFTSGRGETRLVPLFSPLWWHYFLFKEAWVQHLAVPSGSPSLWLTSHSYEQGSFHRDLFKPAPGNVHPLL